jgi:hypothetical protein
MSLDENSPARARNDAARPDDDEVLTIRQWCKLNGFSKSTGERILRGPKSQRPRIVQLSTKLRGITKGANRAWLAARSR